MRCDRCGYGRRLVESPLEDGFDVASVRRGFARSRQRSLTGRIHSLSTVLLGATQNAEHGAISHLRIGVLAELASHDFLNMAAKLRGPIGHALGRPIPVVLM